MGPVRNTFAKLSLLLSLFRLPVSPLGFFLRPNSSSLPNCCAFAVSYALFFLPQPHSLCQACPSFLLLGGHRQHRYPKLFIYIQQCCFVSSTFDATVSWP